MKIIVNKAEDVQIAYIGGGSRGWAWGLMSDLAVEASMSGMIKLYDINHEAARDNEIIGNRLSQRADVKGKWRYQSVESIQEALEGVDFVVISILPGTFDEMASDVHEPEKYGIYQAVGDTVGPGGLVRALRTIPMFVEIGNAIKQFAPEAWVINYTNPMTLCVRTLYSVFPQIKAFGCCHEVFNTQHLLSEALRVLKGIAGVSRDEIKVNVLGINHFTWLDKACYGNMDLFPIYKEFVDAYYEEGFEGNEKGHWMNSVFASANRVKFDLFRRYGLIAAAGDRHLAEFVPGSWYLKNPETASAWKFNLTPVSWRKQDQLAKFQKGERLASGQEPFELKETGEEGVRQMKALLGLGDIVTNVNIPNVGQLADVPHGCVVETNAHFSGKGIQPMMAGRLPDPVQGLVIRHVYNQETILKGALHKDKELVFRAFVNDPLVTIGLEDARDLFERMLKNTAHYLPGWNL